jgi:hypothetical protein
VTPFDGFCGVLKAPGEEFPSPRPTFDADGVSKAPLRFADAALPPFEARELGVAGFNPSSLHFLAYRFYITGYWMWPYIPKISSLCIATLGALGVGPPPRLSALRI